MVRPAFRYLRGYSLDPGFSTRLDTAGINEVVYRMPFESLEPGPFGEYLEVMDFDPASDCWYEPVDLAHEEIAVAARSGAEEGNPAVPSAVRLRGGDEDDRPFRARARPQDRLVSARLEPEREANEHGPAGRREYVQRLRIYPHAIREANAYYSPDKRRCSSATSRRRSRSQGANYPGGLSSPA